MTGSFNQHIPLWLLLNTSQRILGSRPSSISRGGQPHVRQRPGRSLQSVPPLTWVKLNFRNAWDETRQLCEDMVVGIAFTHFSARKKPMRKIQIHLCEARTSIRDLGKRNSERTFQFFENPHFE